MPDQSPLSSVDDNNLPLAPCQQQVWFDQQSRPTSAHLNIGGTSIVYGQLDLQLLEQSLQQLTKLSEALRLCPNSDGRQRLVAHWPGSLIDYQDVSHATDIEQLINNKVREQMNQAFVLNGHARPWQVFVWKMACDQHYLWIKFHHLVMDGFGTAEFFKQWSTIHNAMAQNAPAPILDGPTYRQHIDESLEYLASESYQKDHQYWRQALPCVPNAILQKLKPNNSTNKLATGLHHYTKIANAQYQQLEQFAKANKVTAYHVFVAALAIYLCRTTATKEIVIGVPVLNRRGKRFKSTLGMFSAVMPLRISLGHSKPLVQLLAEIASGLRGVYRHSRYPLYHLSRELNLLNSGRDIMFDVLLSFEPHSYNVYFDKAHLRQPRQLFATQARYPLLVNVCLFHEDAPVELALESSSDYFTEQQTQRISRRLHHLLISMSKDANASIDLLPLVDETEKYELLTGKHADVPSHKQLKPFIKTFEHLASLNPQARALLWLEGEMNYQQFNLQANRLAQTLLTQGIKQGDILGVIASRSPQTLIAFFALAKLSVAFLPIDPQTSDERVKDLLSYGTTTVVLISSEAQLQAKRLNLNTIIIDSEQSPLFDTKLPDSNPGLTVDPDAVAIVLFTSGSTGKPKGVMMSYGALAKRMAWLARSLNFTPADIALQSIQLTFDPCLIEILLPLTHGASVALPPPGQLAPTEVAYYAERFAATYLSSVPTIMRYICQTASNHPNLKIKHVGCGGERLTKALAQDFVASTGGVVYNFWGLTETTIFATAYRYEEQSSVDPIAIGEPIDDTTIYVLDENLQLLPSGCTGEIHVGGSALALGYLNEPELTAQKFIDNPFEPGSKMFKCGDLGYWDENGQLQFVSRIDAMLKIRGQRVEPTQVEAALCQVPEISGAAVKLYDNQLHGWLELNNPLPDEHLPSLAITLKNELLKTLPSYMVPTDFTQVTSLPRQSGGKLNYQALMANPIGQIAAKADTDADLPKTDLERLLLQLWQQALNQPQTHINSNFFQLGGNSLDALNLLSAIEQHTGQRPALATLMENPSVKMLAQAIIERHQPLHVCLSKKLQGRAIYLAASGHGDVMRLKPLALALEGSFYIEMLQPPLPQDFSGYDSIEQLAQYYATEIERQSHQTPPVIAGFSIGGISALETARILIARGVPIGGLVLIDSTYPAWLMRKTPAWQFGGYLVEKLGLQELNLNQRTLGSLFGDAGLNGQIAALRHYNPQPLAYPVTLVVSSGLRRWYGHFLKPWRKLFGNNLTEAHLPGFHGSLFSAQYVDKLAQVFTNLLNKN